MATGTPDFPEVDYLEQAKDRLTQQFSEKDIINRYLTLLIREQENLQQVMKDLLQKRSIDTATGAQLDIIGEIVGQSRELIDASLLQYFAFDGYPDALPYGDLDDSSVGGTYYSYGKSLAGNVLLDDEQYRLFIRAKIMKNTAIATPEELLTFISFVFGAEVNAITSEGNAAFTIFVGKELTTFEKLLLTYQTTNLGYDAPFILKPIGVRINYGEFNEESYFGFLGTPNAKGYGDLLTLSGYGLNYGQNYGQGIYEIVDGVGGKYASLL